MSASLLSRYEAIVASGLIKRDPSQLAVLEKLEGLCRQLRGLEERAKVCIQAIVWQACSMRRALVSLVVSLALRPPGDQKSRVCIYTEGSEVERPC